MAISRIQKRILRDLLKYRFIAQSVQDEREVFFLLPDKTREFLKGQVSFNQLRNAKMVDIVKEIGNYKYYKISDKGFLQITITNNKSKLLLQQ